MNKGRKYIPSRNEALRKKVRLPTEHAISHRLQILSPVSIPSRDSDRIVFPVILPDEVSYGCRLAAEIGPGMFDTEEGHATSSETKDSAAVQDRSEERRVG